MSSGVWKKTFETALREAGGSEFANFDTFVNPARCNFGAGKL